MDVMQNNLVELRYDLPGLMYEDSYYETCTKYSTRKYRFHGTSHKYIS